MSNLNWIICEFSPVLKSSYVTIWLCDIMVWIKRYIYYIMMFVTSDGIRLYDYMSDLIWLISILHRYWNPVIYDYMSDVKLNYMLFVTGTETRLCDNTRYWYWAYIWHKCISQNINTSVVITKTSVCNFTRWNLRVYTVMIWRKDQRVLYATEMIFGSTWRFCRWLIPVFLMLIQAKVWPMVNSGLPLICFLLSCVTYGIPVSRSTAGSSHRLYMGWNSRGRSLCR